MFNKKSFLILFVAVFILLPYVFALAAGGVLILPGRAYVTTIPYWGIDPPILPCYGLQCTSACDFIFLAEHLIMFLITLGVFALAPLIIAIGGIMMLISGSSPEFLSTGKKMITGTVIGIVFCLTAWLIIATLVNVLGVSGTDKGKVGGFGSAISCNYSTLTLPGATP